MTTQTTVDTALVAFRQLYDTCVHFDDEEVMLVIPKEMWVEMKRPRTLRVVLTEED